MWYVIWAPTPSQASCLHPRPYSQVIMNTMPFPGPFMLCPAFVLLNILFLLLTSFSRFSWLTKFYTFFKTQIKYYLQGSFPRYSQQLTLPYCNRVLIYFPSS